MIYFSDTEASQACFRLLHNDDDDDVVWVAIKAITTQAVSALLKYTTGEKKCYERGIVLLLIIMHARMQIFIQLSATLTKLYHIKRDHHNVNVHHRPKRTLGGRT